MDDLLLVSLLGLNKLTKFFVESKGILFLFWQIGQKSSENLTFIFLWQSRHIIWEHFKFIGMCSFSSNFILQFSHILFSIIIKYLNLRYSKN